jgi:hypothetical protein
MISSPNPAEVPIVTCEYLFCPSLSDWIQPPAQRRAWGYCQGLVPWVPWATGYNPKFQIQLVPAGKPYTPYWI